MAGLLSFGSISLFFSKLPYLINVVLAKVFCSSDIVPDPGRLILQIHVSLQQNVYPWLKKIRPFLAGDSKGLRSLLGLLTIRVLNLVGSET